MNVLMLLDNFPPYGNAGTEQYVLGLARELAERDCRVLAAHPLPVAGTPGPPVLEQVEGVAVARVPVAAAERSLAYNPRMREVAADLARDFGADLAHVHNLAWFTTAALDGLDAARVPPLATLHDFSLPCAASLRITSAGQMCHIAPAAEPCAACAGLDPASAGLRLDLARQALLRFRRVVFPSLFSRKVHHDLGFATPRALRQPLGLPPFPARPAEHPAGPAAGPLRLAYLGGITWFKGLDLAVSALAALPRGLVELSVHGSANNPAYLEKVRAMAPAGVRWCGAYTRQDLPGILARAEAVVLPSRMETFSFVAREALHAGVPVLAAKVGALPEVVRHEVNGLLFPAEDSAALALALARLAADPGLRAALRAGIGPVKGMAENAEEMLALYAGVREKTA